MSCISIADEIGEIEGIAEYPEFNLGGPFSTFAMKIGEQFFYLPDAIWLSTRSRL